MSSKPSELDEAIERQLQALGAALRPSTVNNYRGHANAFLRHIHLNFPEVRSAGQLQRNPHILAWLQSLAQANPPLAGKSRRSALICMRRLLEELADSGYPVADNLILTQDLPRLDRYLPRAIPPETDALLDRRLRRTNNLLSNALLLMRATGIRIGECLGLTRDSLRHLGEDRWALHVPLGKLHTERLVPMDEDARNIFHRILALTGPAPDDLSDEQSAPLLLLSDGKRVSYHLMSKELRKASEQIGSPHIQLHQLRHTFATAMLRSGMQITALKEILGHLHIQMTMRYVQVTQDDLQREYHLARNNIQSLHALPQLSTTRGMQTDAAGMASICIALDAIKHQLEMHRRGLSDPKAGRKLRSLARRVAKLHADISVFREE